MSIRMRHTRGHTGNRRSHHALLATQIIKDKESGNFRLPHHIDEVTGMYRGKQIAPAQVARLSKKKVKDTSAKLADKHEHVHEHAEVKHKNAEVKAAESSTEVVKRPSRKEA